jgi:hypothetical protein
MPQLYINNRAGGGKEAATPTVVLVIVNKHSTVRKTRNLTGSTGPEKGPARAGGAPPRGNRGTG